MKSLLFIITILVSINHLSGQLYFPPNNSSAWATMDAASLGWCQTRIDSLYRFLEANNTKAFILLKDGKIVLEKYLNGHSQTSSWYWASAGKTLTSALVGIAQQEKKLKISDLTSNYLGKGWTSCTPAQEEKITIRHQLTMTSGLDDGVSDPFCTTSSCLKYKSDAGTRWAYHNGPYTLLDAVIEKATGISMNQYNTQKIKNITGMDGLFIKQDFNNVYLSTARSMARFGLMILNKGTWNGVPVLSDQNYYNEMVNTSQMINESYGYLWWLNGKNSFMVPQSQIKFPGSLFKNAPSDMFSALGKNGQFINVVPSQKMVWIRMGDNPDNSLVPFLFNEDIWKYINNLSCTSSTKDDASISNNYKIYPNPVTDQLMVENTTGNVEAVQYKILDAMGKVFINNQFEGSSFMIDTQSLSEGIYFMVIQNKHATQSIKFVKR
jgi:CubicO group peptidase (beta-lactamase class C family)